MNKQGLTKGLKFNFARLNFTLFFLVLFVFLQPRGAWGQDNKRLNSLLLLNSNVGLKDVYFSENGITETSPNATEKFHVGPPSWKNQNFLIYRLRKTAEANEKSNENRPALITREYKGKTVSRMHILELKTLGNPQLQDANAKIHLRRIGYDKDSPKITTLTECNLDAHTGNCIRANVSSCKNSDLKTLEDYSKSCQPDDSELMELRQEALAAQKITYILSFFPLLGEKNDVHDTRIQESRKNFSEKDKEKCIELCNELNPSESVKLNMPPRAGKLKDKPAPKSAGK